MQIHLLAHPFKLNAPAIFLRQKCQSYGDSNKKGVCPHPKYVPAHNPTSLACLCANRLTSDHDVTRLLYASASCAQPLRSQTVYNLYARSRAISAFSLACREISPTSDSPLPFKSACIMRCITSHTVRYVLVFGFHSFDNS